MRIAYFSEVFLPKFDGVVNTLCKLLDYLDNEGHESLLIAPAGGPVQYASTVVIGLRGIPSIIYPDMKIVPPVHDISLYIEAFEPDIIHLINPFSLCLSGLWSGLQKHIPVVASYQTDMAGFAGYWGLGIFSPIIWSYLRYIHNQADLNLAPSYFTRKELIANQFKNVEVWSRGVDTTRFTPEKYSAEMRQRLSGGHPDSPLLLYTGRLSSEKRIVCLRRLLDELPGVRLAMVGDGPQREELESLFAGTSTVFTGFLAGEELAQAYASADVFVFPGANETFGNVVLEAMASGLPVIVPDSGGVVDFVRHEKTGLTFNANSIEDLTSQTRRIIQDPALNRQVRTAGLAYARNRRWNQVFDRLMANYKSLLKPARRTMNNVNHDPFTFGG